MKSYLDLIPISAKNHKKQGRMTLFCIILSVFLVTVICIRDSIWYGRNGNP